VAASRHQQERFEPVAEAVRAVAGTDRINVWAQYVFGYRAPNYREINGSFRNPVQGYGAAPNGDLDPEKSRSFEVGVRYTSETVQSSVAMYDNRYTDFIEQVMLRVRPIRRACLACARPTSTAINRRCASTVRSGVDRGASCRSGAWMAR
jgi:outer membrane receptor protein involved in Fe transport